MVFLYNRQFIYVFFNISSLNSKIAQNYKNEEIGVCMYMDTKENYITRPNLPEHEVKTVVIDYRAGFEIIKSLKDLNINIIKTTRCDALYSAINGHPDILLHHIGNNKIVLAPNVYKNLSMKFLKKGFAVMKGDTWLHRNYPENIAYNVLRLGNYAFHNLKYTDKKIRELYEKMGIEFIHVKQGYSKCLSCIIDEKTVITSDKGIAKAMETCDIDVLLIKTKGIELKGFDYGFIGGASGLISKSKIALTGNMEEMKDKKRIIEFLEIKGITVKFLSSKKIIDIGSIIPLTY